MTEHYDKSTAHFGEPRKTRAEHLLHMDLVEEGWVKWRLTCEHDDKSDFCDVRHGPYGECWLMSWWDGIGSEIIGKLEPPLVWPLPVRPDGYGEDVTLVKDEKDEIYVLRSGATPVDGWAETAAAHMRQSLIDWTTRHPLPAGYDVVTDLNVSVVKPT